MKCYANRYVLDRREVANAHAGGLLKRALSRTASRLAEEILEFAEAKGGLAPGGYLVTVCVDPYDEPHESGP